MPTRLERGSALAAGVAVTLAGAALLWQLTGGLQVFTSESWRRAAIASNPRVLPDVTLEDHRGRSFALRDLCGKPLIVDFVYTQCPTVCKSLGASSSQLARRLADSKAGAEVTVLSVSFDPLHDTPVRLAQFKRGLEASETAWTLARPRHDTDALLNAFGVVTIPDGSGGFEHNAALHAVDRSCRIARVFDLEDVDDAEHWIRAQL